MNIFNTVLFIALLTIVRLPAQYNAVWIPDNGDGTYNNPVIFADYSDPDVIRVGEDFFMTASSFNCVPGLPILHSKDLVNWRLVNHAIKYFENSEFDIPQHGNGVWAPSIRFHDGMYYIYWGDPDQGIFMVKSRDPFAEWDKPILVKKAYGNIDPCPFWDEDGKVYMVHAFAHSRAGVNSILQINELNAEGTHIIDKGRIVFDGHVGYPTIEGPKLYKRNSFYYIFAPAGGVPTGWQTILRSKSIYGPYEAKVVLEQGSTNINGPHQGGWVSLRSGEDWFIHFQDHGPYGRITHLNPVYWQDDWPLMGIDYDENGIGEPVKTYKKPKVGRAHPIQVPQTTDEFNQHSLGLQWQWQANFKKEWFSLTDNSGFLRLKAVYFPKNKANKWLVPNMLLQKFPSENFEITTHLFTHFENENEKAALIIMGLDYAFIQVQKYENKLKLAQISCFNAEQGTAEEMIESVVGNTDTIFLRVNVEKDAICRFSFSLDGSSYQNIGKPFHAREGKWIGAKAGLFVLTDKEHGKTGYADFDWFRIR